MLLIPDASKDERLADNPFVTGDFHLRFCAGVPIRGQLGQLKKFAAIVEAELQR